MPMHPGTVLGNDPLRTLRAAIVAALLVPTCAAAAQNDLRDLSIGMPVSALPSSGYGGFACTLDPAKKLTDWAAYQACPASPDGTRAVSFRYGDGGSAGDEGGKTEVAGQPVELALLIGDKGRVAGIKIDTDPHARLYLRKKAFLFALQVRARYGEVGWTCSQKSPTPEEQPVGGTFFHEHCEKVTATRHLVLDRQLFHDPTKDLRDFTSATQLTILGAG
jgi:hypothetical protein